MQQMRTTLRHDGPNHLGVIRPVGLRCTAPPLTVTPQAMAKAAAARAEARQKIASGRCARGFG